MVTVDGVIKLVKTYRLTAELAERLRLAEEIFVWVEPELRLFIFARVAEATDDVLQETLKAIATGLGGFRGASDREFWGWTNQIARNKVNDYLRRKSSDPSKPMEPNLLAELFDSVAQDCTLSAGDKMDLEQAMAMLRNANPECHEYLWQHFIAGHDYAEIAAERSLSYDAARMRIGRCLGEAQSLLS